MFPARTTTWPEPPGSPPTQRRGLLGYALAASRPMYHFTSFALRWPRFQRLITWINHDPGPSGNRLPVGQFAYTAAFSPIVCSSCLGRTAQSLYLAKQPSKPRAHRMGRSVCKGESPTTRKWKERVSLSNQLRAATGLPLSQLASGRTSTWLTSVLLPRWGRMVSCAICFK